MGTGFTGEFWVGLAQAARYDPPQVAMRTLRFVPLAFVAGVDGFAFFAPYMAAVLLVRHVVNNRRRARRAAIAHRLALVAS